LPQANQASRQDLRDLIEAVGAGTVIGAERICHRVTEGLDAKMNSEIGKI
jgi:hypothetical protein